MAPSLLVIAGPATGTVLPLDQSITIGRAQENTFRLRQQCVSRVHCRIENDGTNINLIDQSSYGTFINGVPVRKRELKHGDKIKIGDSLLLVLLERSISSDSLQFENDDLATCSLTRLAHDEIQSLGTDGQYAANRFLRPADDLAVLLDFATSINRHTKLESVQSEVLECIFRLVHAERAAILLLGENTDDIISNYSVDRTRPSENPMRVSRTVVQEVLKQRVAILSSRIPDSETSEVAESLLTTDTRSLISVPLFNPRRVFGLIYLTSTNRALSFSERHLHFAGAVANIASVAIERVRYIEWLRSEKDRLQEEVDLKHSMVGDSAKMRAVLRVVAKVSQTDSNVLILGESGTGKELVARAIHKNSARRDKPFIAVNCAALTETLLESELFGHEKGAFTGAIAQKKGKLEVVDGGSLFLDEIGELNPALQAKLLRVLQERTFERVGGTRPIAVDIRLIAATNRNLKDAMASGLFRVDLFYRLSVVEIELPPLRERREDIILLAQYFAAGLSDMCNHRVQEISPEACSLLTAYDWPGNIRELQNAIERAVVLGTGPVIMPEDLPETVRRGALKADEGDGDFYETLKRVKKQLILSAFEHANGDHIEAAKRLGIHPNNLHRLLRTLNLRGDLNKA
jgi:transcriptional regulator with GAF, ATPase, and Fis domain